jgi:hypoxanthine-DNA glycosylase
MLQGLPPLLGPNTRVLILGSFPGVRSLELQQYYAHPQNQLWRLVFSALSVPSPIEYRGSSYEIRSALLLKLGVGLWDVYAACEREGSLDSAIQHAQPNDLASLRKRCPQLQAIAHNGAESYKHAKHTMQLGLPVYKLPSSSPANASWSFERKLQVWRSVLQPHLK